MKRYIDADGLANVKFVAIKGGKTEEAYRTGWNGAIECIIENAPTADVVEVVRCNDCKHQEHCYETVAHTRLHDGFKEHWSESIEWCSRGERKGGDTK